MSRRTQPAVKPSKLIPALLGLAIVAAGFATLMVRLEVTEEGYRISALGIDAGRLDHDNQQLRLQAAELSSHERLRALAVKYGLAPAAHGRVVMMP
jgi:cell division protein FtsL